MDKRKLLNNAMPIIKPINHMVINNYYKGDLPLHSLEEERVLLLAPHVDDETIGAGGTLMKHAASGAETHVIFLTDGSGSYTTGSRDELVEARKKEAQEIQNILGLHSIDFYTAKDGQLKSDGPTKAWVRKKIETINPDVIYAPVFVDCHSDHIATAQIVRDLLVEMNLPTVKVRLYEINTLLPKEEINCVVDITPFTEKKKQAIDIFQSQTIDFDGFLALQKQKSNLVEKNTSEAVETFLQLTPSELKTRFDRLENQYQYSKHFKQVNKEATLLYALYKNLKFKEKVYAQSHK